MNWTPSELKHRLHAQGGMPASANTGHEKMPRLADFLRGIFNGTAVWTPQTLDDLVQFSGLAEYVFQESSHT